MSPPENEVVWEASNNDGEPSKTPPPSLMSPPEYEVVWEVSNNDGEPSKTVTISCKREWSPLGSDRFYSLLQNGYYVNDAFFRVVPGFVAQFGISSDVQANELWDVPIEDDPEGVKSNVKGTVSFATAGPNTRTTQLFVNLVDNAQLDSMGFTPLCEVIRNLHALQNLKNPTPQSSDGLDQDKYMSEGGAYIDPYVASGSVSTIASQPSPFPQPLSLPSLTDPCGPAMTSKAPSEFRLRFHTAGGDFVASCSRPRFPAQVDRVYNLARLGYYSDDYVFRVVDDDRLGIVQFGTGGVPSVSNVYNYESVKATPCSVVEPQPSAGVIGQPMESNLKGWLSMSTSSNADTGTTWNATAELFINTRDNPRLDPLLFVPLCYIGEEGMKVVDGFPSFGEVSELGGFGPR